MIYNDIKDYIQDKYGEMIANEIEKRLNENSLVDNYSDSTYSVKTIAVKGLVWQHKEFTENVVLEIRTEAKIVHAYSNNNKRRKLLQQRLFFVNMSAKLFKGLHETSIDEVIENYENQFEQTNVFDEYFLPRITSDNLEEAADGFTQSLCTNALYNEYMLPINDISNKLKVEIIESELPENVFGRVYFRETTAKHRVQIYRFSEEVEREFPRGTIIINKEHHFMENYGSPINTVAHEFAHWYFHKYFFEVLCLLNDEAEQLSCEIFPQSPSINICNTQNAFYMAEWQANTLATRIAMPKDLFLEAYNICYDKARQTPIKGSSGEYTEMALESTAALFNVSSLEAKNRAIQLGITEAEGVLLFDGNEYYNPITFDCSSLTQNQTYVIFKDNYENLIKSNGYFAELISQGLFVRAECFVVINNSQYITCIDDGYTLTKYAREHANECCLRFQKNDEDIVQYNYEYNGQCFFSKEIIEQPLITFIKYNNTSYLENLMKNSESCKEVSEAIKAEWNDIAKLFCDLPNSFSGTLIKHMSKGYFEESPSIRRKMEELDKNHSTTITVSELSERTGLSTTSISNYRRNNYSNIELGHVCAICIALRLPPIFSRDMLKKVHVDFPDSPNGYLQRMILENFYREPLAEINRFLKTVGLSSWSDKE